MKPFILLPKWKNKYSLSLDGVNEYIKVNNSASIDFEGTSAFSLSCWVRRNTDGVLYSFIDKRDGVAPPNNKVNYVVFNDVSNQFSFLIQNTNTNRLYVRNTTSPLTTGQYYNLIVTYDGSRTAGGVKLYINNISVAVATVTDALTATSQSGGSVAIGALNADGTPVSFLNGYEDEVSIWNKILTVADVNIIHNGGKPNNLLKHPSANNLKLWLRNGDESIFDGTNWIITDKSNNNNTGTSQSMEVNDLSSIIP